MFSQHKYSRQTLLHGTARFLKINQVLSFSGSPITLSAPSPRSQFLPGRKWSFFYFSLDTMLQHHRTVVLCGKPTSCLNKQAHTGFSAHIMGPFLFYTKNHSTLNTSMKHLSSTASESKRNCVIKGCGKNHTGCSSDPLLLLHLMHNKPNKYAYPRS